MDEGAVEELSERETREMREMREKKKDVKKKSIIKKKTHSNAIRIFMDLTHQTSRLYFFFLLRGRGSFFFLTKMNNFTKMLKIKKIKNQKRNFSLYRK